MNKTYNRSPFSLISFNPFALLNPNYYINFITYSRNFIELTEDAVVLKRGMLDKRSVDIPYNKINSLRVERGILGSMLGFGDVIILSGNDIVGEAIKGVVNPDNLKADIQERINIKERINLSQPQTIHTYNAKRDNLDQLEKLAELKDKGIITEHEFESKKKQLLGLS